MSSRVKRKERTRNKGQRPQPVTQEKKEVSLWRWFGLISPTGKIAAAFALALTVIGTYFTFSSKISVEPSHPMEPLNLFTTPFVISNDGLLPVYSLNHGVSFKRVENEVGGAIANVKRMGMTNDSIPSLQPGEKSATGVPNPFGNIISGDIDFIVSYRPALSPWKVEKVFRFGSSREADGKLIWRHRASSEQQ